ncbi:MAG: outer membrane protein assembly factor BamD [Halieaceae bacterium]|nr:outer membrane protein assembly factor BamD [Halieaceae bacterium]
MWLNAALPKLEFTTLMTLKYSRLGIFLASCLFLLLGACASNDELDGQANAAEQQIYSEAQKYLRSKNYDMAIKALQRLESRYPFGKYAEQAQLEIIYAHYGAYEPEAAIEAADRFIRLHPQHPSIDYAYYMKGLAAYSGNSNIFSRFLPTSESSRDTKHIEEAFTEFAQLLARFPESEYAADARARMVHLRNLLARHEIDVANYYFLRGAYLAALNRGRYVIENYQGSTAMADALAVVAHGYLLLDMPELAQTSIDTLKANYPEHPSLQANGEFNVAQVDDADQSWINKVSLGLFDPPQPPQFNYEP